MKWKPWYCIALQSTVYARCVGMGELENEREKVAKPQLRNRSKITSLRPSHTISFEYCMQDCLDGHTKYGMDTFRVSDDDDFRCMPHDHWREMLIDLPVIGTHSLAHNDCDTRFHWGRFPFLFKYRKRAAVKSNADERNDKQKWNEIK